MPSGIVSRLIDSASPQQHFGIKQYLRCKIVPLTPWDVPLREKLTVAQLVVRLVRNQATLRRSSPNRRTSFTSGMNLSVNFTSDFLAKIWYTFLMSSVRAKCPAGVILSDFSPNKMCARSWKAIFSILLLYADVIFADVPKLFSSFKGWPRRCNLDPTGRGREGGGWNTEWRSVILLRFVAMFDLL
jgi:hypothetical protein